MKKYQISLETSNILKLVYDVKDVAIWHTKLSIIKFEWLQLI